eukprot:NODE_323_length_10965_cov_0.441561.p7 type:complete len:102 gc:universal NODE_323_length_10965_cov_0.441561:7828-8133(+)
MLFKSDCLRNQNPMFKLHSHHHWTLNKYRIRTNTFNLYVRCCRLVYLISNDLINNSCANNDLGKSVYMQSNDPFCLPDKNLANSTISFKEDVGIPSDYVND